MSTSNTLGDQPAFPCTTGSDGGIMQRGMDTRTFMATAFMAAMLHDKSLIDAAGLVSDGRKTNRRQVLAGAALEYADALL